MMNIIYVSYVNGRLIDDDGYDVNPRIPDFKSLQEALDWADQNGRVVR